MPVSTSAYTIDAHTQRDGGRYVRETHTDSTGRIHDVQYKLPAGAGTTEADAFLVGRVTSINAMLVVAEFEELIDGD